MTILSRLLALSFGFIIFSSCSNQDDKNAMVGNWKLIAWTVGIPFDLDAEVTPSSNFLDKTACKVNEILTFSINGIVTSNDTFNPEITIRLKDGSSNIYLVKEMCAEGSIGFSTSYDTVDKNHIELNGAVGIVKSNKLTLVYIDAFKVYNEALTEVIDHKDLTLVYVKK